MKTKAFALLFFLFFVFSFSNFTFASEVTNGYIRLIINESSGRYSIYYLSNPNASRYEPLFSGEDPATSYASILMDGKVYRLGGKFFKTSFGRHDGLPALIFEGENITVTQSFKPVKSANSKYINGIMVTYAIQNTGSESAAVGLRILIDTDLGENLKNTFLTGEQIVKNETLLEGHSGERFWISRGKNTALMGSIINPVDPDAKVPDLIHFANWKRLNDAPWKIKYVKKRSFTNAPYSINDSAVCYFYDPQILNPGSDFTYSIVLSTEDVEWYNSLRVPAQQPAKAAPAAAPAKTVSAKTAPAVPAPPVTPVKTVPAPVSPAPAETKPVMAPTIDIKQIEMDAYAEAMENGEDVNAYTLKRYQEILNQFITGEIKLNEQDIIELDKAIDRYR